MKRLLALGVLFAVLIAACGGGSDNNEENSSLEPDANGVYEVDGVDPAAVSSDATGDLFTTVNPLGLLTGFEQAPPASFSDVDADLLTSLLTLDDLPDGFSSAEEIAYAAGGMEVAGRIFATGDLESDDPGTMVMSMAIGAPDDLIDELYQSGALDDIDSLTDDYFSSAGMEDLISIDLLDASGLGETGVGIHMELDLGAFIEMLAEAFDAEGAAAAEEELPFSEGISMEMYVFVDGDRILMLGVVWPSGDGSGLDTRGLAEAMDARS